MLYIIYRGNKMNNHKLLKIAGVLLLSAVMLLSASAVTANTTKTNSKDGTFSIPIQQIPKPKAIASFVDILSEGFETAWVADSNGDLAPPGWQVHKTCTSGTDPFQGYWHRTGTIPFSSPGPVAPHGGSWQAFVHWSYDHQDEWLVTPILNLGPNGNLEFWFYGHYGSTSLDHYYVKLSPSGGYNQADFTVTLWDATAQPVGDNFYNTPVEINLSAYNGQSVRLAWQFVDGDGQGLWHATVIDDVLVTSGGGGADTTPPVTTISLNGTMSGGIYTSDVKVNLTATDDSSGVNHTYYKLDAGALTTYTAPFFTVSANGAHTVLYYSVDKAGNKEDNQTKNFTIAHPVTILITIKGGFGVSAVIKNNGTTALTNVSWSITLDGKLIFVGKTKTGTNFSLAPGAEKTIKDPFVFGFGKTNIDVTVGTANKNATGTVLLFFVIRVA